MVATEKRLIDAGKLRKELVEHYQKMVEIENSQQWGLAESIHILDVMPTVDAVEVVHAQWVFEPVEFTYEKDIKCSACGEYVDHATNYCPNCGAKMDGERRNNGTESET